MAGPETTSEPAPATVEQTDIDLLVAALVSQSRLLTLRLAQVEEHLDRMGPPVTRDSDRSAELELRLRSARLDADLHRLAADLHDRIDDEGIELRVLLDDSAASVLDLTEQKERSLRSGGWQRADPTE